jgi:predicted RNase H-like nuclease (RuvC/YqgF family)
MRLTAWLKSPALLCVLCVAAWPMATQSRQQGSGQQPATDPVADAARKAREQKKVEPKPKKVYTDDDFRGAPPPASGEKAGEAAKAGTKGAEGTAQAAKDEKNEGAPGADEETKWRKRFKEMHDKIAQAEEELNILQRELNKGQVQYYSDPQKALAEQNSRKDINEKTEKIDTKKKEVEQLKQDLSNMEDALRKSGGDIGWARE